MKHCKSHLADLPSQEKHTARGGRSDSLNEIVRISICCSDSRHLTAVTSIRVGTRTMYDGCQRSHMPI